MIVFGQVTEVQEREQELTNARARHASLQLEYQVLQGLAGSQECIAMSNREKSAILRAKINGQKHYLGDNSEHRQRSGPELPL